MINFFYNFYAKLYSRRNQFYYIRLLIRIIGNVIIPFYLKVTFWSNKYSLKHSNKSTNRYIVSLTSFPARIQRLWIVIETILRQDVKPDMIVLFLSTKQFPTIKHLPKNLLRLQKRGLIIKFTEEDYRSYKKFYYSAKQYPDDIIITVDDDIIYPSNFLSSLINAYQDNSNTVICRYAHRMLIVSNVIEPYLNWGENTVIGKPDNKIFFGSGGGTLFPVGSLKCDFIELKDIIEICPLADDVWLNALVRYNSFYPSMINVSNEIFPVLNIIRTRLSSLNVNLGENDKQIENVCGYFDQKFGCNPFTD